ncbi:MAG TPA: Mrp/NBP35 family ATP-binding protein [Acidimicrobiia bacterium]|nr:Mrp/NBP35 family ATP-binding protein [Acidimicrobiia bacterium]
MTVSDADVRAALRGVEDPELGRSVTDLGMVAGVERDGPAVVVRLALPLPEEGWPPDRLDDRVRAAALALPGVERVAVEHRPMTEAEAAGAARVLRGEPAANPLAVVDAAAGPAPPSPRRNPFTDAATRVLAVASGKGGVGKSSVTTNLAVALAARGHRAAALDADVWGFSLPRMFGVDHPPGLVDDVIVPPRAHGVQLVSMGFFARDDQAVIWRGPMLHKALEQFITDVHWNDPDQLLVDLPPGTGDVALSMAQLLPRAEVIVVTTPQPAAQRVAQRSAAMAERVNLPVVGVVENMSWFTGDDGKRYEIFGAGGGQALADQLGVPLLGQIPLVPALRAGGDEGRPITVAEPDSEAAAAFVAIAERLDALAPRRVRHPELRIS